jgi:N-acetylmuramoyl-L-alanine amidase
MDYSEMSDLALLQLCIWREARGEPTDGKRGVAHVIKNRSLRASWWNRHIPGSLSRVILFPYQFSSFNANDPNQGKWPSVGDESFAECCQIANSVMTGADADNTDGATYYYDDSIAWPKAWGNQSDYVNTLNVGRLNFYKLLFHPSLDAQDI